MKISLRHEWRLVHIMALALIAMVAFFVALVFLPFPNLFLENTLYYLFIVPYALTGTPIEATTIQLAVYVLVIYSFFAALITALVTKRKVISLAYVGLYMVLAIVFDKLFGHLF